jgi:beta-ribofuranosylaminobenzene 5'-phosphate synthase
VSGYRVETGPRLHVGFRNLSLERDRLYGAIGIAIDTPRLRVTARPAPGATADPLGVCAALGIEGVATAIEEPLPLHVGLGSGTQTALALATAASHAAGDPVDVRTVAPQLGRGGRSGIGVAAFEAGGLIVDAGQPTAAFTADVPRSGTWTVPAVTHRARVPPSWRFVLVRPQVQRGRSGDTEETTMRAVIEAADSAPAAAIDAVVDGQLLPALKGGDLAGFGAALAAIDRHNGRWYTAVQGGTHRSALDGLVDALAAVPGCAGAGQSSWGPTVYGVTDHTAAPAVAAAAEAALAARGLAGTVTVAAARDGGARCVPASTHAERV